MAFSAGKPTNQAPSNLQQGGSAGALDSCADRCVSVVSRSGLFFYCLTFPLLLSVLSVRIWTHFSTPQLGFGLCRGYTLFPSALALRGLLNEARLTRDSALQEEEASTTGLKSFNCRHERSSRRTELCTERFWDTIPSILHASASCVSRPRRQNLIYSRSPARSEDSCRHPVSPFTQVRAMAPKLELTRHRSSEEDQKPKQKPIVYEDYPEVVPQTQPESSTKPNDVPADNQNIPPHHNLPSPATTMASPDRDWNQTPYQPVPTPAYQVTQTPPPFIHQDTGFQHQQQQFHNPPQMLEDNSTQHVQTGHLTDTVTPLNLLGDQPDKIDCPFCQKRSDTKVTKHASKKTQ